MAEVEKRLLIALGMQYFKLLFLFYSFKVTHQLVELDLLPMEICLVVVLRVYTIYFAFSIFHFVLRPGVEERLDLARVLLPLIKVLDQLFLQIQVCMPVYALEMIDGACEFLSLAIHAFDFVLDLVLLPKLVSKFIELWVNLGF
jgi:hypothetical protein